MPHMRLCQYASRAGPGREQKTSRSLCPPKLRSVPSHKQSAASPTRRAVDCVASHAMTNESFRLRPIGTTGKSPKVCPLPRAKIFRLTRRANQCSFFARLTADEGRVAIVTNVAVGCGGREACVRRTLVTRTAKSCGPDAAVLASSCAGFTPCVATVAKEPFTGESTK